MRNIDLIEEYNRIIEERKKFNDTTIIDEGNASLHNINTKIKNVVFEIAEEDQELFNRLLYEFVIEFQAREDDEKLDSFIKLIISHASRKSKEKNVIFEAFSDDKILKSIYEKQGYFVKCGIHQVSYTKYYRLDYDSEGYVLLANYCIDTKNPIFLDKLLKFVENKNMPFFIFEILNISIKRRKIAKEIYEILNRYINQIESEKYKMYLKLKLDYISGIDNEIGSSLRTIDLFDLYEDNYWYNNIIQLFVKNYKNDIIKLVRYILSKYSDDYEDSVKSNRIFMVIRSIGMNLRSNKLFYKLVTKNIEDYVKILKKLNVYTCSEGYGYHFKYFDLALMNNDFILMDNLMDALSENKYANDFTDLYKDILSNKPKLSYEMIDILYKWKNKCDKTIDNYLKQYKRRDILKQCISLIEKSEFNKDLENRKNRLVFNTIIEVIKYNVEDITYVFEAIRDKISINGNMMTKSEEYIKYGNITTAVFSYLLENYDMDLILNMLNKNSISKDLITKFISNLIVVNNYNLGGVYNYETLTNYGIGALLERKYEKKDFINDELMEKFIVYFNGGNNLKTFLERITIKNYLHNDLAVMFLSILSIWKSEKYSKQFINEKKLALAETLSKDNKEEHIITPYYILDILIETDVLTNKNFVENEIKKLSQKDLTLKILFENLYIDNFIKLMDVSKYFFDEISRREKLFFYIMRNLLGFYKFDAIMNYSQICLDSNYYSINEIIRGLQKMLLLKKGVVNIDHKQINFLEKYCDLYSHVPESIKLKKKLINLKRKIGD